MSPESPSIFGRMRAGVAATLAWLAGGAHRLEDWSSRGSRSIILGLVVVGALLLCTVSIVREGRAVAGWMHDGPHGDRHALEARQAPPKPFSKPDGRPEAKPVGKPELRRDGPRPPAPPEAPAPPPPPVAP